MPDEHFKTRPLAFEPRHPVHAITKTDVLEITYREEIEPEGGTATN